MSSPSHYGSVVFEKGAFVRKAGTTNWKVWPVKAFDPPIRAPVGMIEITFEEPLKDSYTVMVSPGRIGNTPMLAANYGDVTDNGFVVYMWETIADRVVQNADFSFAVYPNPE